MICDNQLIQMYHKLYHQKQRNHHKHTVKHNANAEIGNSIMEDFWANAVPLPRWVAKTIFAPGAEMVTHIVIITMKPDKKSVDYTISYGDLDLRGLRPLGVCELHINKPKQIAAYFLSMCITTIPLTF